MSRLPLLIREMASVEGFPDEFLQKKSAFFLGCHVIGLLKLCPIPAVTWSQAFSRAPYRFLSDLVIAGKKGSLKPERATSMYLCNPGGGEGGLSFIRGGSATGSNPLTFYIPFF